MTTPTQPTGPQAEPTTEPARTRAPALPAKTLPGEGGLRRLPGVVLFARGWHTDMAGRTKHYDDDYLETVARNFSELLTDPDFHHEPPACLGHEAVQAKLAEILAGDDTYQRHLAGHKPTSGGGPGRTDEPAAGWWKNLRYDRPSGRLTADLENIPPSIADRIDSGEYRYPSVELKETAVRPDGRPVGPFLWRCPILGATPPGCKTIPALGESHFADAPAGVVFFADAYAATAPAPAGDVPDKPMLALLQKCYPQLSAAFLASLSRRQVDQLAADHVGMAGDAGQPAGQSRDQLIQAYVSAGLGSQADAEQMTDDQLKQALSAAGVTAMADSNPTDAAKPKPKPPAEPPPNPATPKPTPKPAPSAELAAFADGLRAEFAEREAALDAKAEAIRRAADAALATQKARDDAEWDGTVRAFASAQVTAGRMSPAEVDPTDPLNWVNRTVAIPRDEVIAFADADGKPQTKSRREAELDAIRKRPVRMFGEAVRAGKGADDDAAFFDGIRKQAISAYEAANAAPEIPVTQRLGMLPPRHLR